MNMKIYKVLILLITSLFLLVSCDALFSKNETKELGSIRTINNGIYTVDVKIRHSSAGWNIYIGDSETNSDLKNKKFTIAIVNHGSSEISFWTKEGEQFLTSNLPHGSESLPAIICD